MSRAKQIIINAFRREKKKERGMKIVIPDIGLAEAHIKKARHNLAVMDDLGRLGHSDWVVIVAYYAMYHGAMSILIKIGLNSKDHAATVAVLEYFFSEDINKELLERFNELKENSEYLFIEDKILNYFWSVKNLREIAQYGTNTFIAKSDDHFNYAKEFILKIRVLLEKLDEDYVELLVEQIKELYKQARI